jgi:hypothetical protein
MFELLVLLHFVCVDWPELVQLCTYSHGLLNFNSSGASLSSMCQFGLTAPVSCQRWKMAWYASVSAFAFLDLIGSASM